MDVALACGAQYQVRKEKLFPALCKTWIRDYAYNKLYLCAFCRRGKVFEEKVFLLTKKAIYICSFHYSLEKVVQFKRIGLQTITRIEKGTLYSVTFSLKRHWRVHHAVKAKNWTSCRRIHPLHFRRHLRLPWEQLRFPHLLRRSGWVHAYQLNELAQ